MRRWLLIGSLYGGAVLGTVTASAIAACGSAEDCDFGRCASVTNAEAGTPDGPMIGDANKPPDVITPPTCNEAADPRSMEAKGCLDDTFALFVDGDGGDDTQVGSRAKPLKKIEKAVSLLPTTGKKRIYVCGSATFTEHLKLTQGANLHGGFACSSWNADPSARPKIAPTDKGYVLHVENVGSPIVVSDLELLAADVSSVNDGTSSIAVFATNANITFLRATIIASNAADGAPGEPGGPGTITKVSSGLSESKGNPATNDVGGRFKECTCSSWPTFTKGGGGGSAGTGGGNGEPSYGVGSPNDGAAGLAATAGACDDNATGNNGANAPPAADAPRTTMRGKLEVTGWEPAGGADGLENGKPGQGGGGGGAVDSTTGAGGGGCGGCGGFAGKGSGGGGASIAIAAIDSTIHLKSATLETKKAGVGGLAGAGGAGVEGGTSGLGLCPGGKGGRGADGGSGAGGAGGVSIGVLFKGMEPRVDASTTIRPGAEAAGGRGGKSPALDGPDGVRADRKNISEL